MIGPVHPEVRRALQEARMEEVDRSLKGCRRAGRRRQGER
jgi:hypothetical protein